MPTSSTKATTLRRLRKELGDDSLKAKESQFRKAAKQEQAKYSTARAGSMVPANKFITDTLKDEGGTLLAILAGN